ncbi:histidine kinase [uncultured Microbacterium sp.]|uniref:sensor histidine kinase n=1 Tax=uncultured Microbacterium sp. TaxID=191216 RepID=UPI0028DC351F|nr:histidine kinase [uncultured Microbacterium sp.]
MHRHPRLFDTVVVLVYAIPTLAGAVAASWYSISEDRTLVWGLPLPQAWVAPTAALVVLAVVAVALRRSRPWLLVVVGCAYLLVPLPIPTATELLPLLFGLYALGAYRSSRAAWTGFGVATAAGLVGAFTGSRAQVMLFAANPAPNFWETLTGAGSVVILLLVATLIGTSVGGRRRYTQALIDRAERLAFERDQQAVIAAAQERNRIAGEMHDVIAHSVTVMIALSDGAAAAVGARPDAAAETMREVGDTGRRTLAEVRRLLGVLHEDDGRPAERMPQPGADQLAELVDGFRAAGLKVAFRTTGTPTGDPSLGLVVYRLLQESLTNALRYAGDATVSADVHWSAYGVAIEVADDGPGAGQPSQGAGRGLVGMRERAALYGGTVEAGPRPGGGWGVTIALRSEGER